AASRPAPIARPRWNEAAPAGNPAAGRCAWWRCPTKTPETRRRRQKKKAGGDRLSLLLGGHLRREMYHGETTVSIRPSDLAPRHGSRRRRRDAVPRLRGTRRPT